MDWTALPIFSVVPDFDVVTDEDWRIAIYREAILAPLATKQRCSHADIEQAAQLLQLHRSMVFRLLRRYRADPKPSSLLPDTVGRKRGSRSLSTEQEQIITREIDTFYLRLERPPLAALHRQIWQACRQSGVTPPSYRAVQVRVEAIDLAERVARREGVKAAQQQFAPVQPGPVAEAPFDLVQIDHTPVDVLIVDDVERRPIGRPWLTLAIDVATRVVAGFCIALERPSSLAVALTISHVCLPKNDFLRQRQIEADWPVAGLPRRLHLDNAKEFHGQALTRGCREYGIELSYRPPHQPHFGGHIERLIGTMMGEVHLLPGTTFSSVADRRDYDSAKTSAMTLEEFETWFTWQVVGVYHQTVHASLDLPPLAAWKMKSLTRPGGIRTVPNPEKFYLDFLPVQRRKVRRDGLRLFHLQYCDSALLPLLGRSDRKYPIRYDPRDLSKVYLKTESGEMLTIPYRDLSRPKVTLWEVRWAREHLRQQGRLAVDEENLFRAIAAQWLLLEQVRIKTQAARRKVQQQRLHKEKSMPSVLPATPSDPMTEGPFQPYAYEVWDDL